MAVGYSLNIPENWNRINLTQANMSETAEEMADNMIAVVPELESRKLLLKKDITDQLNDALESGTNLVASYVTPTSDGSLSMFLMGQTLPLLMPEEGESIFDTFYEMYTTADETRPQGVDVQIAHLPHAGKVFQTYGIELLQDTPVVVLRTLVPLDKCVLSVFIYSPNVDIKDALAQLFEAITRTLEIDDYKGNE
ncbi:hypothetical protein EJ419_01030 [Alloscardovia theropitheci]|uniref:Uncharacterized protein n=1 Tax=Alloscardovia theropitheci TaxID=2496842 RepID=A0A4R0QRM0_9BIFI|nr:hypothetical protein [Alloscardovia theropitheci]TCD55003.1 hypothetical protein EJ419_01030 [Alloscardovia theropitheci]